MSKDKFISDLRAHTGTFAKAVATDEGDWIVKGFIDIHKRIYTISVDTKIVSKVIELLLFPMLEDFAVKHGYTIELPNHQNHYPDATFIDDKTNAKYAVDIKSTYRKDATTVNGMTLGAFTGYFRNRQDSKNISYPYSAYQSHVVLGALYTKVDDVGDERSVFQLDQLLQIPSVIKDFQFFVQPKYRIASDHPGSGNTKNIGSTAKVEQIINGTGAFAELGEEIFDDYWMFYLTKDMAQAVGMEKRPYANLKEYYIYKQLGNETLSKNSETIMAKNDDDEGLTEEIE